MTGSSAWIDGARDALERRIEATCAQPDFLDMVTRAHALDPQIVPEQMVADADGLAPVADIDDEGGPARQEAALDAWLGDVRAAVERRVDERSESPPPQLQRPARDRRALWWLGGAVAAALALALGLGPLMRAVSEGTAEPSEQAVHLRDAVGTTGSVEHIEPAPPRMETRPSVPREAVVHPPAEVEDEAGDTGTEPRRGAKREDRLASLAERAQVHWRAGRREQAQRLFAKIVAEGGRSRAVEMAYADLFTLAHQAGDGGAQRRWWRGYLRRFSRGRFADDARAGLCRTAPSADREACWSNYLQDFPRGSFRAEARGVGGGSK